MGGPVGAVPEGKARTVDAWLSHHLQSMAGCCIICMTAYAHDPAPFLTCHTTRRQPRRTVQGKSKGVSSIFNSNPAFAGGEGMLLVESLKNHTDPDGT